LWRNREVALAWAEAEAGGLFLESQFPESFRDDAALLLAFVKHKTNVDAFSASPRLRADNEFMLKAVELNGRLLNCIAEELMDDFDLILTAFSDMDTVVYYGNYSRLKWIQRTSDNFEFLANFSKTVKEKLRAHENFIKVLCGIAFTCNEDSPNCHLPLFNQGKETSLLAYTKIIAEYVDVPTGKELRMLRRAHKNLGFWGF
jgi:hypothetical protein